MKHVALLAIFTLCFAVAGPREVRAGGPLPDTREDDFAHVCRGGTNAGDSCSILTEETDCPRSKCIPAAVGKPIRGTLTLIAHDAVTDWATGGAGNQALTLLLEVRGPDHSRQLLSATYQDLQAPQNPPTTPGSVVVLPMDELGLRDLSPAVNGLLFVQPQARLAEHLRSLFGSTGIPALVFADRKAQVADHTGDNLATVVRFKVQIQFLVPAA